MSQLIQLVAAIVLFAATTVPSLANIDPDPTRVRWYGSIAYQTGGIGLAEAARMRDLAPQYPLSLEFLERDEAGTHFSPGEQVVLIKDVFNNMVFSAESTGPFMLINLPEGKYHVVVDTEGYVRHRDVVIDRLSHDHLVFWWPADQIEPRAIISSFEEVIPTVKPSGPRQ